MTIDEMKNRHLANVLKVILSRGMPKEVLEDMATRHDGSWIRSLKLLEQVARK